MHAYINTSFCNVSDHVDEMILQFSGREEELINTLKTMQEKSIAQRQQDINLQHRSLETDKEVR